MTVLLILLTHFLLASTQSQTNRRSPTPAANGKRVSMVISSNSGPSEPVPVLPEACISNVTRRGVRITPTMLEKAALRIAAAVFPPATEVKTTEVETVEGNTHK